MRKEHLQEKGIISSELYFNALLVHSVGKQKVVCMSTSLKKGRQNKFLVSNCHLKFDREYCARLRRQREKNTRGNGTKKAITQGCADIFFEISQSSKDRVSICTTQVL